MKPLNGEPARCRGTRGHRGYGRGHSGYSTAAIGGGNVRHVHDGHAAVELLHHRAFLGGKVAAVGDGSKTPEYVEGDVRLELYDQVGLWAVAFPEAVKASLAGGACGGVPGGVRVDRHLRLREAALQGPHGHGRGLACCGGGHCVGCGGVVRNDVGEWHGLKPSIYTLARKLPDGGGPNPPACFSLLSCAPCPLCPKGWGGGAMKTCQALSVLEKAQKMHQRVPATGRMPSCCSSSV